MPQLTAAAARSQPGLDAVAALQDSVVTRAQLAAAGVSPDRVAAQLAARRWQPVGPLVVVLHSGTLAPAQQLWAAVLGSGPRAALCGRTAAGLDGLTGWDDGGIHVVVPRGERPPPLPGVPRRLHESRRFDPDADVHPARTPRRTRIERSLLDAAVWTPRVRSACGLAVAGVQQRLAQADGLLEQLARMGAVRHRRVLAAVLLDVGGGAQALSEVDFGRFCRRHGLPAPIRQAVRRDPSGRRRYLDAVLRGPRGTVAVEIDGAVHLVVGSYWSDMARANEIVIAGEGLLRFATVALYADPDVVADQLRRALGLPRQPTPPGCQNVDGS